MQWNIGVLAGCMVCSTPVSAQDIGGVEVYKLVSPAVVQVFAYSRDQVQQGRASGLVLRDKGWLITNYHAVGVGLDIAARHGDDDLPLLHVVRADSTLDLAIFAIDTAHAPSWYRTVPVLRQSPTAVQEGEVAYVIGNPYGFTNTISRGIVSGLRQDSVFNYIQTDAAMSPGNSGGALVNGRGELIGMPTWVVNAGKAQNLNFAIPLEIVTQWSDAEVRKDFALLDPMDPLIAGCRALRAKDYRKAVDAFLTVVNAQHRDQYLSMYFCGVAYEGLGQRDSATACYNGSTTLSPTFARGYWRASLFWLDKGYFDKAVEEQQKAYALDPRLRLMDRKRY